MSSIMALYEQNLIPIFGALRADSVQFLLNSATKQQIAADQTLFIEGSTGESCYLIESGKVQIVGHSTQLAILEPGHFFGEIAMFGCQPRSASAITRESCVLWEFTNNTFFELYRFDIEQFAILQMNISREVIRRFRKLELVTFELRDKSNH